MRSVIAILSIASTILLAPFFLYLAAVTLAAIWPVRRRARGVESTPRFLILIPAHNEEYVIAGTVESCLAASYPRDRFRVVVVADNCADLTADVARGAGAEVVERFDLTQKSKGYAIEYALALPELAGFDAVVVIDADTIVDPWILSRFADKLAGGYDWLQAYYTVRNADDSWRTRLMTYAFSLINGVWQLGHDRIGLGASLRGNGMCFSAAGLARVPHRVYGLVEDLEFSWTLHASGEKIGFVSDVRVYGEIVRKGGSAAKSQRKRWEAGRRAIPAKFLGPILRSARLTPHERILFALRLVFPTLVSLALGLALAIGATLLAEFGPWASPMPQWLLMIQGFMALTLIFYAMSPFMTLGLPPRYLGSLLYLPYYAVWKLAVAAGRGPTTWVRTRREAETAVGSTVAEDA